MTRDFDLTDATLYHHWVDEVVRFSDTDMMGHVNNTAMTKYVESGRLHYDFDVLSPASKGADEPFSLIIANLNMNYLAESFFPGRVRVGTRLIRVGNSSITTAHGLFRENGCFGTSTCVMVNKVEGGSRPLGPRTRARLERLLP
ncbi:MAG TPA: acyl-CoA thioesterase [Alphaproteobacteria bacterium]|nr:acyl-CoA thioesterase [Alphaproteobacteria bacterium]